MECRYKEILVRVGGYDPCTITNMMYETGKDALYREAKLELETAFSNELVTKQKSFYSSVPIITSVFFDLTVNPTYITTLSNLE